MINSNKNPDVHGCLLRSPYLFSYFKAKGEHFITHKNYAYLNRLRLFFTFLLFICSLSLFSQQEKTVRHKVQLGENLFRISLKYNVKLEVLREWNNLTSDEIKQGQSLIVGYEAVEEKPQTSRDFPLSSSQTLLDYDTLLAGIVDQVEALYLSLIHI